MSEILDVLAREAAKKIVRVSVLTFVVTIAGFVGIAVYCDRRVTRWEHALATMENGCWRLQDQKDFATGLKINNPALSIPDPAAIVTARRALESPAHAGEAMAPGENR